MFAFLLLSKQQQSDMLFMYFFSLFFSLLDHCVSSMSYQFYKNKPLCDMLTAPLLNATVLTVCSRNLITVLELLGGVYADLQFDLYYVAHWSLVWLSSVFGSDASRISFQFLGCHQRTSGIVTHFGFFYYSLPILPMFLQTC